MFLEKSRNARNRGAGGSSTPPVKAGNIMTFAAEEHYRNLLICKSAAEFLPSHHAEGRRLHEVVVRLRERIGGLLLLNFVASHAT